VALLMSVDRAMLSRPGQSIRVIGNANPSILPEQVIAQSRAWLESIETPTISGYQMFGDVGANLVCIPFPHLQEPTQPPRAPGSGGPRFGGPTRETFRLLIAVVPIHEVEVRFLKSLNDQDDAHAWLIDERMTAMAASRRQMVGANMADISDPDLRALAIDYIQHGRAGTEVVEKPFSIGTMKFIPTMVAGEAVRIGDTTWELFITTELSKVDGVVNRLFHRALLWGAFVIVSITAILVSTAMQMIGGRVRLERVRHEMIDRELTQAREIQLAWLPDSSLPVPSIDIAAINSPASHISGDFYNWFELPDGRLVVTIGDVTGHGMAAAFLMATTQLLVRNTMARLGDPGECLAEVNRQLCVQVFNGQFVTMLIMVLDLTSGALEMATAGHPAPLLADGESFQPLPLEPQLVLGIERNTRYVTEKYQLAPQSSLLLYTDGVVECLGTGGTRFSTDGLQRTLYGRYHSAQAILDRVIAAVDAFRGGLELTDDLTLVAIQLQAARVGLETVNAIG
jgi:serine phosphatase RsbU (regulator of sigma subunit)